MIESNRILTYGLYASLFLYGLSIFAPYLAIDFDNVFSQIGAVGILFFYTLVFITKKQKTWNSYLALFAVLILFLGVFGKLFYPAFGLLSSNLLNLSYFFILGTLSFGMYNSDNEIDKKNESALDTYTFGKEDFGTENQNSENNISTIKKNVQYLLYFFICVSIVGFVSKLFHFYFAPIILVIGFVSTAILVIINGFLKTQR